MALAVSLTEGMIGRLCQASGASVARAITGVEVASLVMTGVNVAASGTTVVTVDGDAWSDAAGDEALAGVLPELTCPADAKVVGVTTFLLLGLPVQAKLSNPNRKKIIIIFM